MSTRKLDRPRPCSICKNQIVNRIPSARKCYKCTALLRHYDVKEIQKNLSKFNSWFDGMSIYSVPNKFIEAVDRKVYGVDRNRYKEVMEQ